MALRALKRLRDERGFTLVTALGMMIILGIAATTALQYSSTNARSANVNMKRGDAGAYAEAALSAAYAVLNKWDTATGTGNNATTATLLGCNSAGTVCTPVCVNVAAACPTASSSGVAGTGTYYGKYNSTLATWTITAYGYAANPTGAAMLVKKMVASVAILADINQPANVAVWNHMYSTAPQGSGCEVDVQNDNVYIDVPVYVTGDMCLSGSQNRIWEQSGGQPVDVRIGGKMVFAGTSTSVGYKSSGGAVSKITSAAIQGGCTNSTATAGTACNTSTWNTSKYFVTTTNTFTAIDPPVIDTGWYATADPGPTHPCKAGNNVPYTPSTMTPLSGGSAAAPLASTVFESAGNTSADHSAANFDLTPAFDYTCLSQTGSGQISWDYDSANNGQNNKLYISGVIYIDGNVTISRGAKYDGLGSLYVGGTFLIPNTISFCAVNNCTSGNWNPNTEMFMVVALGPGTSQTYAVNMSGGAAIFQGGMFAPSTATIALNGWAAFIQGPLVAGKFIFNQWTSIYPLPVINNLPPGAPLAVNARAVPQTPVIIEG
jgi:type II secretory pathway pseudopilin PulG